MRGQPLDLGGGVDQPEPVAQPLHRGAGDEDRALEGVDQPVADVPGDRGQQAGVRRAPASTRCWSARTSRCRRCTCCRRGSSRPARTARPAGRRRCRRPAATGRGRRRGRPAGGAVRAGVPRAGMTKYTYGTGSFVLMHVGSTPAPSPSTACSPPWWTLADGTTAYALEGAIFVTGAAVQWLRDGLGIIDAAAEIARRSPPPCPTPGLSSCPRSRASAARAGIRTPAAPSSASPAAPPAPTSPARPSRPSPSRSRRCRRDGRRGRTAVPALCRRRCRATTCCCKLQADELGVRPRRSRRSPRRLPWGPPICRRPGTGCG